jgi:hypothetical protein
MKKLATVLGMAAISMDNSAMQGINQAMRERPKDSKGNPIFPKSPLTKKQKRLRVKNRLARKSRKINRK